MMLGMIHDFVQCRHYDTAQNQSPEEDRFVNSIPIMHKTRQRANLFLLPSRLSSPQLLQALLIPLSQNAQRILALNLRHLLPIADPRQ